MPVFARELIYEFLEEVTPLTEQHLAESSKRKATLAPMWSRYAAFESTGNFLAFTVRDNGSLVGYAGFFVGQHLHHADTVAAINDVLYIKPEHRNGFTVRRFIRFIEAELKPLAQTISFHVTLQKDFRPLLHRLGYADEEIVVSKSL